MNKKFSTAIPSSAPSRASFRLSEPPSFRWFCDLPAMARPPSVPPETETSERRRLQALVDSLEARVEALRSAQIAALEALESDFERRLEEQARQAGLGLQRLESEQRELLAAYQDLDLYAARLEADRVGARQVQARVVGERDRARCEVDELRESLEQYESERVSLVRNPFSDVPGASDGAFPESAIHRVSNVRQVLQSASSSEGLDAADPKRRAG